MRPARRRLSACVPVGLAVALLAGGSGPAVAATAATPAAGTSTSELTLLTLTAADQALRAGVVQLLAETLAEPAAAATVTPLLLGGTPFGRQTVGTGNGPTTVGSRSSAALVPDLAGLVSVVTPGLTASAATTATSATTTVGSTSLGAVRLLGLPVTLEGTLGALSTSSATESSGRQALEITELALPSVADLLAALGIDLAALPVGVLYELLDSLDLLTSTVIALKGQLDAALAPVQGQVDAAQKAVDDATAKVLAETAKLQPALAAVDAASRTLTDRTAALAPLQTTVTTTQAALVTRQQELATATTALTTTLGGLLGGLTVETYQALPELIKAPLRPLVDPLIAAVTAAQAAVTAATAVANQAAADLLAAQGLVDAAQAVLTAAQSSLAVVQGLVDAAQQLLADALAALDTLLRTALTQIGALVGAVTAVLDGTPLVSLDALSVVTRASVVSAADGGQTAELVGGRVTGLKVLGTDVLDDVLGTTTVDLLELTTSQLGAVQQLVDGLTGTLSSVLSSVPGFPTLSVPAPTVDVLTGTTDTGVANGFGTASVVAQLLQVTLPAVTVPAALQLPGAGGLPAFAPLAGTVGALALGDLTSTPVGLGVGSLGPQASFRPAVAGTAAPTTGTPTTGTPTTGTPTTGAPLLGAPGTRTPARQLPRTGAASLVAVAGVAMLGAAALLRRRRDELDGLLEDGER